MVDPARPAPGAAVWLRLSALLVVVLALAGLALLVGIPDAARIRAEVRQTGPLGAIAFGAAYTLAALTPLPKTPLTVAAGTLFGVVQGSLIVIIAATLSALLAFGAGRLLGRPAIERCTGRRMAQAQRLLERRGLAAVLIARLVPVIPFTALNYAAGTTHLRLRPFVLGTVLGIVPATTAYVALGRYGSRPTSWQFGLSLAVLAGLTLAGWLAARRSHPARPVAGAATGTATGSSDGEP